MNVVGDEWGWQASSRGQYLKEFTEQFQQLSPDSQQTLVEQLGRYHAQLPDELYFEAMDELIRLKLPVPEAVKTATHDFMSTLVKTYAEHPEHQGLDLWVKRYLARHDHPDMRGVSEHQSALLAFERERTHKGDTASIEWPVGIPTEQIYPFINRQQERQSYLLRQTGVELELIPEQLATTQAEGWGISVTLLKLALGDTRIFHRYTDADGNPKQVSLNLEKGKHARIPFPPGSNHQLQVGAETFQLEILSATDKPDWVAYRGMENETTWVETHDNSGKQHRWYWHPPEVSQDQVGDGQLPRFLALPATGCSYPQTRLGNPCRPRPLRSLRRPEHCRCYPAFPLDPARQFPHGFPQKRRDVMTMKPNTASSSPKAIGWQTPPVTQALWQAVMGENPSHFKGETLPVENVSWDDITPFLQQLNRQQPELAVTPPHRSRMGIRLPRRHNHRIPFRGKDDLSSEKVNYSGKWDDYNSRR